MPTRNTNGVMEYTLSIPRIITSITLEEAVKLAELAAGNDILELGALFGFSTVVMAQVAKSVCSIDWHKGDQHAGHRDTWNTYRANLEYYGITNVDARRGRFEDILPVLAEQGILFHGCFLDGNHTAAAVQTDLNLTLPLIRKGGFVAFHDYGRSEATGHHGFGVTEIADQFGIDGVVNHLAWGIVQ